MHKMIRGYLFVTLDTSFLRRKSVATASEMSGTITSPILNAPSRWSSQHSERYAFSIPTETRIKWPYGVAYQ